MRKFLLMSEGGESNNKRTLKEKAEAAFRWAEQHVVEPCGRNDKERAAMRKAHAKAVGQALAEPGVEGALTRRQLGFLRGLEIMVGERKVGDPKGKPRGK